METYGQVFDTRGEDLREVALLTYSEVGRYLPMVSDWRKEGYRFLEHETSFGSREYMASSTDDVPEFFDEEIPKL